MDSLTLFDKTFRLSIDSETIAQKVAGLAAEINRDLKGEDVYFIVVLNGAFMFASDLFKKITLNCCVTFLKISSYVGNKSTGTINQLIGLNENIKGKTVVVIEDIVDTGNSLNSIIELLTKLQPKEIKIACLLFKPECYKFNYTIDYTGFKIPNDFIVGYGLDYNGYGRNLNEIYTVIETQ